MINFRIQDKTNDLGLNSCNKGLPGGWTIHHVQNDRAIDIDGILVSPGKIVRCFKLYLAKYPNATNKVIYERELCVYREKPVGNLYDYIVTLEGSRYKANHSFIDWWQELPLFLDA